MKDEDLLQKAISIAFEAHKDQLDKYGAPYLGHVTRVMNAGTTIEEKILGVLHDVVEDASWTFEQLEKEGFPANIIEALKCVTKKSDDEDYDEFVERTKQNKLAVKVKLNDLTDNMDIKRMSEIKADDLPRLNKYLKAFKTLKGIV